MEELAATTKKKFLTFSENYVIISYKVERGWLSSKKEFL
jgi:hypothetical protein